MTHGGLVVVGARSERIAASAQEQLWIAGG